MSASDKLSRRVGDRCRFTALLDGGLGNQMFQYAMVRSMCVTHGAQLVLDSRSAFWLDRQYKRSYQLHGMVPNADRAGFGASIKWIGTRAVCKIARCCGMGVDARVEGWLRYFREPCREAFRPISQIPPGDVTFIGYWQSPRYFEDHASVIHRELFPPRPARQDAAALGDELRRSEAIAIGLRLYEESSSPESHASDGKLKSAEELSAVVRQIQAERPHAKSILFCTHIPKWISDCGLPSDTLFAVPERGYICPQETLWLLAQCRHHVFSNSTLYWWGAWLSQGVHSGSGHLQKIFAANNFHNRDCIPPHWKTF